MSAKHVESLGMSESSEKVKPKQRIFGICSTDLPKNKLKKKKKKLNFVGRCNKSQTLGLHTRVSLRFRRFAGLQWFLIFCS